MQTKHRGSSFVPEEDGVVTAATIVHGEDKVGHRVYAIATPLTHATTAACVVVVVVVRTEAVATGLCVLIVHGGVL